jgi:diacylglycerol kinase (ATP)
VKLQGQKFVTLIAHMRVAAILGLGRSQKDAAPFQSACGRNVTWHFGVPALSDQSDVIVLFGGDGTVHRHLHHLVSLGLPVLVVPKGSGNDFARALGLRSVRDSLAAWRKFCAGTENVRSVDLGTIASLPLTSPRADLAEDNSEAPPRSRSSETALSFRYFVCVAGVGLDAEVSRRANRLPRWLRGNGGYVVSLLPTMFRFAAVNARISTLDPHKQSSGASAQWNTLSDQPTLLAAFANTPTFGGGMKIAPRATIHDGLLDVCIVAGLHPLKLFCLFPTVYFGNHLQVREVLYSQAARLRLETERPLDVYADGEFVCRTPVEISTHRAALRVIAST